VSDQCAEWACLFRAIRVARELEKTKLRMETHAGHARRFFRRKNRNGKGIQFWEACCECRVLLRGPIKGGDVPDANKLELESFAHVTEWLKPSVDRRMRIAEMYSDEWWNLYAKYMDSPEWMLKRAAAISRDKTCVACSSRIEHVHHLTYENVGDEPLVDLVGLCKLCHEAAHSREFTTHNMSKGME